MSLKYQLLQGWPRSSSEGDGASWIWLWLPVPGHWWMLRPQPQKTSNTLKDCTPILGQCGSWVPQMDLKKERECFWQVQWSILEQVNTKLCIGGPNFYFCSLILNSPLTLGVIAVGVFEGWFPCCFITSPPGCKDSFSPLLCHCEDLTGFE